jgi:excisionase family DNA binding protein
MPAETRADAIAMSANEDPWQLTVRPPEELLEDLAERVAERVLARLPLAPPEASPWLDFDAALAYLGFSRDRLYKLTAARAIPFRKKRDGQGLLFHRGELNRWLEREYPPTGCAG